MDTKRITDFCEKKGIIVLERTQFPLSLQKIHDPPQCLYLQGNISALSEVCLGVVGTRKPSSYGLRAALNFSKVLSEEGFCIVSGLARGIDSAAHQGAILGGGKTIAVLAHGHDEIYPCENARLAAEIVDKGGAVISEYPPFYGCRKYHFVARNRIIAGLSKGVLVIEASKKSGSLLTANFANDFGRDVFVVPGPYDDKNYLGSHELIQYGAKLVSSVGDVLEEYSRLFRETEFSTVSSKTTYYKEKLSPEFSFEDLFELAVEKGFSAAEQIEKWLDNKLIAQISPQQYIWLN